ncbi:MAG: hypothetical protein VYE22_07965 [Myxococcota bacterium]|nr:hypothetical protein [Myxococcota bacterium]
MEVIDMGAGYALGLHGPVLIQLWEDGTPDEGAVGALAAAKSLAGRGHAATGSLVVVAEHASLPSAEARQHLSQLPSELGKGVGVALVREGEGFRSAAVRAVMTGIMMFSRDPVPHQILSTVGEGAAWLRDRMPGLDPAGLEAAVSKLRAQLKGG